MGAEAEPKARRTGCPRLPRRLRRSPSARLRSALASRGINRLYTHQAEAFEHVLGGRNVVTITPTASGNTLCYNAPVLNAILQDSAARALYLFDESTGAGR